MKTAAFSHLKCFTIQHKSLKRFQYHSSFIIHILYIRNQAGGSCKVCQHGKLCFMVTETAHNKKLFIFQRPCIDKQLVAFLHQCLIFTIHHNGILFSECNQFLIIMEHRPGICDLCLHINFCIVWIDCNPWRSCSKPCLQRIVLLHRCSGIVAAFKSNAWSERFMGQLSFAVPLPVRIDALDITEII